MDHFVSIVVPAYNVASEIEACLQSVQAQTYPNWELLVVNDGSKDDTAAKVEKLAAGDPRIRLINQTNAGVSNARNTGLLAAKGDDIAFLDGDDLWDKNFLQELIAAKKKSAVNMVYCGYSRLYHKDVKLGYNYAYADKDILKAAITGKTQIHIGAILVERKLLTDYHLLFTDGCLVGQDQEFIIKLLSVATAQSVPKELLIYRKRAGSAIRSTWNWRKHIHAIYGLERAIQFAAGQMQKRSDETLQQEMNFRLAYKSYKFLWRMLRYGFHDEARRLLAEEKWQKILSRLETQRLSIPDRIKYSILAAQNRTLWSLAAKIG